MKLFDAHIHLFEKPYSDLYQNTHIKNGSKGESALYEEYREKFDIGGAFVICYDEGRYRGNNHYVRSLCNGRPWIFSFGYVGADPDQIEITARKLLAKGHFGLSCYLEKEDNADWLTFAKLDTLWEFLETYRIPVSFNMSAFQAEALGCVLEKFPDLILIISHMARPKVKAGKLDVKDYTPLLDLANHKNIYIKLSGFYAFVKDGWRYPQSQLFIVVDALRKSFGTDKLLFASDFSPVLEYNTFKQTVELLRSEYNAFTEPELKKIYWKNAMNITKMRRKIL